MTARAAKPRNNRKSPGEAGQPKPTAPVAPGSRARHVELVARNGQTDGQALAAAVLGPEVPNASTAADYSLGLFPDIRLQDCIDTMQADIKAVNGGNLDKLEGMLTAQAGALNVMFNTFAKRAIHADVMPSAYSAETGHPFRRKLDTHSSANWTPVPGQTGHSGRDGTGSRFGFYS